MRRGWHLDRQADAVTLSRRWPARFDVVAQTHLPPVRLVPLTHMIRQDVWRALRRLRGFSPVISAQLGADGVCVRAGGQVDGACARRQAEETIRAVLDDPRLRARWVRCAR